MVESRAEWKQLKEAEWMMVQETELEKNVPYLRHMLDEQMVCDQM